ncbi:hypothetical protein [Pararhizobium sp. LjRoot238]|uniref:hypothetical protein n=1 Tax=Pararhizobium sp. LjRoot238 TaxID=3342293 RepID=UPI003ECDCA31
MGAILALMMTGFAVVGVYKFLTKQDFRQSLLAEFAGSPIETTFVFCGAVADYCSSGAFLFLP